MHVARPRQLVAVILGSFLINACGDSSTSTKLPLVPADLGTFTLTVSGALSGTTHLSARPILDSLNSQRDFVGMNSPETGQGFYSITVLKASSDLGPSTGIDQIHVDINPFVTRPGLYPNNSCVTYSGRPAACVGVNYSISRRLENSIIASRGFLNNLEDARNVVTIKQIDPNKIRLSITGPFTWTHLSASGRELLRDTVFVTASFEAYQAHR